MEIATALLALVILLLLMILGLVFSCFVILIRARAAGSLGPKPPEETGGASGSRPPDEEKVKALIADEIKKLDLKLGAVIRALVNKLVDKGTLTRAEADDITKNL